MRRSTSFILQKAMDRECLESFRWCIFQYGIRILVEIAGDHKTDWSSCGTLRPIACHFVYKALFSSLTRLIPLTSRLQPQYSARADRPCTKHEKSTNVLHHSQAGAVRDRVRLSRTVFTRAVWPRHAVVVVAKRFWGVFVPYKTFPSLWRLVPCARGRL